jgi:hypothetical protein
MLSEIDKLVAVTVVVVPPIVRLPLTCKLPVNWPLAKTTFAVVATL